MLAYQFVQAIRQRLKAHGIHESWSVLRDVLSVQRRFTASFVQKDGRTLHVRKTTRLCTTRWTSLIIPEVFGN